MDVEDELETLPLFIDNRDDILLDKRVISMAVLTDILFVASLAFAETFADTLAVASIAWFFI